MSKRMTLRPAGFVMLIALGSTSIACMAQEEDIAAAQTAALTIIREEGPKPGVLLTQNGVPPKVGKLEVTYGGSGCPQGTLNHSFRDGQLLARFEAYRVFTDERRRSCTLSLDLEIPDGWQYAVLEEGTRGFADLRSNVVGLQRIAHYVTGEATEEATLKGLAGAYRGGFTSSTSFADGSTAWTPCEQARNLNVQTELRFDRADASRRTGRMDLDTLKVRFQFRRCR